MKLFIAGAGLSGLLAARMLQDRDPVVFDSQPEIPNNHSALLRFRSNEVSLATNIPFSKVMVHKHVLPWKNPIADAVAYSIKATGKLQGRSILDTKPVERYLSPSDFIPRLARGAFFAPGLSFQDHLDRPKAYAGPGRLHPIISTIPMPALMDVMNWQELRPDFQVQPGWTVRAILPGELECSLSATIYNPRPLDSWYRASIVRSDIIIEGVGDVAKEAERDLTDTVLRQACAELGVLDGISNSRQLFYISASMSFHRAKYQKIAKLNSGDTEKAKRFIIAMTERHNIYSLGRFATWRPEVLLDDVVNDVRAIGRLLDGGSGYELREAVK